MVSNRREKLCLNNYSFQNTRIYTLVYVSEYFQNHYILILINIFLLLSSSAFFSWEILEVHVHIMKFWRGTCISVRHGDAGDAVASPTLKNWPLFGQKFSKLGQSIQLHSHVSEVVVQGDADDCNNEALMNRIIYVTAAIICRVVVM